MNRGKKAVYNSLASAASQIVSMICGFILPHLILSAFGSSYNGITSSVAQFLSVIALLRAGVGGATRVSLYKSLADNNIQQVSATVKATELFMRKVALIFSGIVVLFSLLYPYLVKEEFDWLFAASLVLVMSLSTFVQYFFGITYQFLFQADQRQYITSILEIIAVIVNTLLSVILIRLGVGIHGVKLGSAVAFSITPIALSIIAKKRYHLDPHAQPDYSSISQRWDAFFHQLASFIHNNTDITLLTIFTNTREISVYTVYYLVANGLKHVMSTLVVGVESAFGNIIAKQEMDTLQRDVIYYETLLHVFSSILFGAAIVLVTPFVQVYTKGINDVNYSRYMFGYLAIVGEMLYVLRSPYEALVNAAGHFKQTKKYAFAEAGINLIVSILLVRRYGITGVVIGTVIAIVFRNISYGTYTSKVILHRALSKLLKRFCVTASTTLLTICISHVIPIPAMVSYFNWILYAIEITLLSVSITFLINILFYKNDVLQLTRKIRSIIISIVKR
jgi:O-antigen/teichoic acid export membrane protein